MSADLAVLDASILSAGVENFGIVDKIDAFVSQFPNSQVPN